MRKDLSHRWFSKGITSKLHFGDSLSRSYSQDTRLSFWHKRIHEVGNLCQHMLQLLTDRSTLYPLLLRGAMQLCRLWSLTGRFHGNCNYVLRYIHCLWKTHKQVKISLQFSSLRTTLNLWILLCHFVPTLTVKTITNTWVGR